MRRISFFNQFSEYANHRALHSNRTSLGHVFKMQTANPKLELKAFVSVWFSWNTGAGDRLKDDFGAKILPEALEYPTMSITDMGNTMSRNRRKHIL